MVYTKEPTVYPYDSFNAEEDGIALRSAMKGFGTDEDTIIEILANRSNAQRQKIADYFANDLSRDLIDDLKSELGGHFEDVIVAMVRPPTEYLCKQLKKAMEGMGTNEDTLVEIICSKDSKEINDLVQAYEEMYDRPLAEHLCGETSGELRRLLTFIVTGTRDISNKVDSALAREQAQQLFEAGEDKFGTDESVFTKILGKENFNQLRQIFEEYKEVSGNTIEQALRSELDGDLLEAMLAIVECVQSPPAFFAKRLYKSVHGAGTDDDTLIRIIVSRSEIDLGAIKTEFERIYDKTLESYVKESMLGETSGDYKKALLALIK
ncbi:PREDICTED: annexin B10 isoform X2 [Nicrophorus vespilloides]|uniref:Annexin n=1 Tax=Nicrophorus vespilloides TaxID=110193 RepID=A0ABM1MMN0_NICVS|nr:PREDICTED: annexin B10 isoform X2 [Nicrophorus vespilloides]